MNGLKPFKVQNRQDSGAPSVILFSIPFQFLLMLLLRQQPWLSLGLLVVCRKRKEGPRAKVIKDLWVTKSILAWDVATVMSSSSSSSRDSSASLNLLPAAFANLETMELIERRVPPDFRSYGDLRNFTKFLNSMKSELPRQKLLGTGCPILYS